ncbi:MAG: 16S rRNA (cytosine(967)-C(5))-methyltransferase RsmB, partial [Pseudomonadales bacterium]
TDQAIAASELTPLVQELVFGSLRHYFSLSHLVRSALHNPLKRKDRELMALMIVGAYQLVHMRVARHAAIFETVEACAALERPWARGLVNAVLRKCAAAADAAAAEGAPLERSFEHPSWLEDALRQEYADAEAIMDANNCRAPMALRINLARTSPEAYLDSLEAAALPARLAQPDDESSARDGSASWLGPETRILLAPVPTSRLPGYREGLVAVQDAGAQVAANVMAPKPGERLLDACAAPGGKLFHLMERHPEVELTALEKNPRRLAQLREEGRRLGHEGFVSLAGDATALDWWEGTPYQHVLIDAPCSGTGTLRRHPDIKVLRKPEDIRSFADLQGRLLANLWRVLAPQGSLLYCTCSILAAENDAVVGRFLDQQHDAVSKPLRLAAGRATQHGWQLLPTGVDTDGFYYARLSKAAG